jgi:hypothetical protein
LIRDKLALWNYVILAALRRRRIAEVLEVSVVTVQRDWRIAKAKLHHEISSRATPTE